MESIWRTCMLKNHRRQREDLEKGFVEDDPKDLLSGVDEMVGFSVKASVYDEHSSKKKEVERMEIGEGEPMDRPSRLDCHDFLLPTHCPLSTSSKAPPGPSNLVDKVTFEEMGNDSGPQTDFTSKPKMNKQKTK
ncbi:hypothetical protein TanjilG_30922 [Lupinus angustifolius]|uniref:Uncharacterized protein n=1 Tax=Lupinus angustifolius TaxID=3871 RepID=A0A1J7GLP6_LUPAN|nr:hypothetical protein TanjilG_30922 [Lupinus angustifolius]